jgi:KDO2-lipid IV(A) lauroyltransferase
MPRMESASGDAYETPPERRALQELSPGLRLLFRAVAMLPLRAAQWLGGALALTALAFAKRERTRLQENLRAAGLMTPGLERAAAREAGKTLLELIWFWQRPQDELVKLVRAVDGIQWVEEAQTLGRGIIFVTPHLGCFEIACHYAASHAPITVLYRPPRQRMFRALAQSGRARGNIRLVATNTRGATALLGALRHDEWVGILPDQVPSQGQGEWADFFGRPAFTMTLVGRLQERTGAPVIVCFCERLARGKGYHIHLQPLPPAERGESDARRLNRALEGFIRRKPEQYLWSYNRYKVPAGVTPPDAG